VGGSSVLGRARAPGVGRYERVCTTVVNAYVGPALSGYLSRLAARLAGTGYAGPVLIIQSHGGVAPVADAVRLAAGAVLSGPAGGVAGSRYCARLLGEGNLIPFDMGGTSTDISLVEHGETQLSPDRAVAGQKVALPSLDIVSIGAGGGSIARVDAGGILRVGPESAGAEPARRRCGWRSVRMSSRLRTGSPWRPPGGTVVALLFRRLGIACGL
jgi:N-methylhydantoinase A